MKLLTSLAGIVLLVSVANAGPPQYECTTKEWWQLSKAGILTKAVPQPGSVAAKTFSKPFFVDRHTGAVLGSMPFWLQPDAEVTVLNRGSKEQTFSAMYVGSYAGGGALPIMLSIRESDKGLDKSFVALDSTTTYTGICK